MVTDQSPPPRLTPAKPRSVISTIGYVTCRIWHLLLTAVKVFVPLINKTDKITKSYEFLHYYADVKNYGFPAYNTGSVLKTNAKIMLLFLYIFYNNCTFLPLVEYQRTVRRTYWTQLSSCEHFPSFMRLQIAHTLYSPTPSPSLLKKQQKKIMLTTA